MIPEREVNRKACPRASLDVNRSGDSPDDAGSARLATGFTESISSSILLVVVAVVAAAV